MSKPLSGCCISGCPNTRSKARKMMPQRVKFYVFPVENRNYSWKNAKRKLWLDAVRNHIRGSSDDWEPRRKVVICSDHFVGGEKSEHPHNPAYLPSIFPEQLPIESKVPLKNLSTSSSTAGTSTVKIPEEREEFELVMIKKENDENKNCSSEDVSQESKMEINVKEENHMEENFSSEDALQEYEMEIKEELIDAVEDTAPLQEGKNAEEYPTRIKAQLIKYPQKITKSTGCQTFFPHETSPCNYNHFECNLKSENGINDAQLQVRIIQTSVKDTQCYFGDSKPASQLLLNEKCVGFRGIDSISSDAELIDLCGVNFAVFDALLEHLKHFSANRMGTRTKLLIFLMKLKLGISHSALAIILGVHRVTISRSFLKVLESLSKISSDYVPWLSKKKFKETFPPAFRIRYPDCRVILDCMEIVTEAPYNVKSKVAMYSNSKSAFTVKFLLGCAPNGLVTFASKCYDGGLDDDYIVEKSGILDLIEPGDVVLVNKGLSSIRNEIEKKNAVLVTPPFLTKSGNLTSGMESAYRDAFTRIQVQRCIDRVKMFSILLNMPAELFPNMNEIVHVCCALSNMQKRLKNECYEK